MSGTGDITEAGTRFIGKYRGVVLNNVDPMQIGRIQVAVPDVTGLLPSSWALPCVPLAGKLEGTFMVPQIGAGVWIEFEQGDADYPIWVGGFWGSVVEVPLAAFAPPAVPPGQTIVIQTSGQHLVAISDAAPIAMMAPIPSPAPPGTGGIVLRSPSGAMVVVNDAGIFINNGKGASIEMVGATVLVNKTALVVT